MMLEIFLLIVVAALMAATFVIYLSDRSINMRLRAVEDFIKRQETASEPDVEDAARKIDGWRNEVL